MMTGLLGLLSFVISLGPGTEDNGLAGPLHESLAGKGRRVPAPMNPGPRAALFGDRCHPEVALHASDLWIEFTDGAESRQEPGSQCGTRSGQFGKEGLLR